MYNVQNRCPLKFEWFRKGFPDLLPSHSWWCVPHMAAAGTSDVPSSSHICCCRCWRAPRGPSRRFWNTDSRRWSGPGSSSSRLKEDPCKLSVLQCQQTPCKMSWAWRHCPTPLKFSLPTNGTSWTVRSQTQVHLGTWSWCSCFLLDHNKFDPPFWYICLDIFMICPWFSLMNTHLTCRSCPADASSRAGRCGGQLVRCSSAAQGPRDLQVSGWKLVSSRLLQRHTCTYRRGWAGRTRRSRNGFHSGRSPLPTCLKEWQSCHQVLEETYFQESLHMKKNEWKWSKHLTKLILSSFLMCCVSDLHFLD